MRRCFRFYVEGCQSVSVETWITAAKFSLKIPIDYEDINKIQTEFPTNECTSPGPLAPTRLFVTK